MNQIAATVVLFVFSLNSSWAILGETLAQSERSYGECNEIRRLDSGMIKCKFLSRGIEVTEFILGTKVEAIVYKNSQTGWSKEQLLQFIASNCPGLSATDFTAINDNTGVYHQNQPDMMGLIIVPGATMIFSKIYFDHAVAVGRSKDILEGF